MAARDPQRQHALRVFCLNAYLIPGVAVNEGNRTCVRQAERAGDAGRLIDERRVDIAVLQEVWGGGLSALEGGLGGRYAVLPYCGSWWVEIIDVIAQHLQSRGGLWQAFRQGEVVPGTRLPPVFSLEGVRKVTFPMSQTRSRKGAQAARYSLNPDAFSAKWLVVINTHLDPTNDRGFIEKQVDVLTGFVSDTLACKVFMSGVEDISDVAVMVVGDFNVDANGGSALRESLYQKLGVGNHGAGGAAPARAARDLYGDFSPSPAATYEYGANSLVMWDHTWRVDWQLAVDVWDGQPLARIGCRACEVVRQERGAEVSDHWGVMMELVL